MNAIKITELNTPELELYAFKNEAQLKRYYEPGPGLFICETANVITRALEADYEIVSLLIEEKYLKESDGNEATDKVKMLVRNIIEKAGNVPLYTAGIDTLTNICGFKQTQGVLACMKRKKYPALLDVINNKSRIAILEDVENPTNVGAIFRSAAAMGIEAMILTFGSSDPLYRRSARVSMGTVFQIPWTFVCNKYGGWPNPIIEEIKKEGFKTLSMALSDRAVFLDDPVIPRDDKLAIIFGNEENGLKAETLERSDYIVKIPMQNKVDSLNVAASSAVAFWELRSI